MAPMMAPRPFRTPTSALPKRSEAERGAKEELDFGAANSCSETTSDAHRVLPSKRFVLTAP